MYPGTNHFVQSSGIYYEWIYCIYIRRLFCHLPCNLLLKTAIRSQLETHMAMMLI
ncbi:hypothetical protein BDF19DRAFT_445245, partial [Syncephalis fuscata]